jgi:integrase
VSAILKSDGKPKAQEVEPLKNVKDIEKVKQYLIGKKCKRDYVLFVVGCNVGLRAGDLLKIRIKDVFHGDRVCEAVRIVEQKTDKVRLFDLNKSAKEAIKLYLGTLKEINPDDFLFKSKKSDALAVESAHKIIKTTLRELNIKGNYGTHTLRKTFAYHVYINNIRSNPRIIETLQKILNHSSSAITLRYIGITKEVISSVYNTLNL